MQTFKAAITKKHHQQPEYLQHLEALIQVHIEALAHFQGGLVQRSLKTIYNFQSMRQKTKFKEAFKLICQLRKEMGLPFEEEE